MSYDSWKTSPPEEDGDEPVPCPVCTGDESAMPCGEDCANLIATITRRNHIRGYYVTAHRAVDWARLYRQRSGGHDHRADECMQRVRFCRDAIRALRGADEGAVLTVDIGYGQLVDQRWINGRWVTQRTHWRVA